MSALLHDDVVTPPAQTVPPEAAPKRRRREPVGGGDPLVDAATRILSIPLRQMYAVLWRVGVIEVRL